MRRAFFSAARKFKNMKCIIGFKSIVTIEGENMADIWDKFNRTSLYSSAIESMGVEFDCIDEVTRIDDDSYQDYSQEYKQYER